MRIVTYNIAFGFDARSVLWNALGHFCIHVLRNPRLVSKFTTSVDASLDFVLDRKPDILCLNEVLPDLFGKKVRERLEREGFASFAEARERHHPYPLAIASWVAVKEPAERININLPYLDKTGGGGGTCALYIPRTNPTVFAVHLGLHRAKRAAQAKALEGYVAKEEARGRHVILAGDFNASLAELRETLCFQRHGLEGCSLPTNTYARMPIQIFSIVPDLDHVLWSRNLTLLHATAHRGRSDHWLVSADFT